MTDSGTASTQPGQPEAAPDYDRVDELAETFQQEVLAEAAVWEGRFDSGPGLIVSVSDAARVIARMVLRGVAGEEEWGVDVGPNVFVIGDREAAKAHIAATRFGVLVHRAKQGPWIRDKTDPASGGDR